MSGNIIHSTLINETPLRVVYSVSTAELSIVFCSDSHLFSVVQKEGFVLKK